MEQELFIKANFIHKEIEQIEVALENVSSQLLELEKFGTDIGSFEKAKNSEILSSLGKGVYIKSKIMEKEFFVDVGSNVIVKKTPEETLLVIKEQIKRLMEVRLHLSSQLESYSSAMRSIMDKIQSKNEKG